MNVIKKFRYIIYAVILVISFLWGAYITFPQSVLKDAALSLITNTAIAMGPKHRGMPVVSLEKISLWRLSGIELNDLKILWPATKDHAMISLHADSIKARMGIIGLLLGSKDVLSQAKLYGGEIDIKASFNKNRQLDNIALSAQKIDLSKMMFLESLLGSSLQGIINTNSDINAHNNMVENGKGNIVLSIDNLVYGPGTIALPISGFMSSLTVPKIALGKLMIELNAEKGELISKTCSLLGGDIEMDVKISISMARNWPMSRINGDGWFKIKPDFINNNETLKILFDLIPELKEAQANDNKVGLTISGNITRPQAKLSKAGL